MTPNLSSALPSTRPHRRRILNSTALALALTLPFLCGSCEYWGLEGKLYDIDQKYMNGQLSKKEYEAQYKKAARDMVKSTDGLCASVGRMHESEEQSHFEAQEQQLEQLQNPDDNSDEAADLMVSLLLGGYGGGGGKAMMGKTGRASLGRAGKMPAGKMPAGKMGKSGPKAGKVAPHGAPKKGAVPPKKP